MVAATDVHKSFGKLRVLKGVSMTVRRGEVVVIVGASGSGKTTLIRCLNHLERIDQGRILVNGHLIGYRDRGGRLIEDNERNIARQRQEIGMVFQRFNLFPHLTALGNDFNGMLKNTTLVSVIGVPELLLATQMVTSATFRVFELYLVVALYYLTLTTLWGFVQQWIERRYGEPALREARGNGFVAGGLQRLRGLRLRDRR